VIPACLVSLIVCTTQSIAQTTPPQAPATPPRQTPPAPARQGASTRLTMTVLVTNMEGRPLPEIWVKASGPVDREAATDASGTVVFNNVATGSYRLRFQNEHFMTLERDVTVAAGRPLKASVALNAAPPPPPAPKAEPAPPPEPSPANAPVGTFQPSAVVIEKLIEADFIGRAASKRAPVGCSASTTSTLFQTNEPVVEHSHADTEETLYVVVG
jgi:hypothetical protein